MFMKITEQTEDEKSPRCFNKPGAGVHIYSTQGCCRPSIQIEISMPVGNGEIVISQQEIEFFVTNDILPALGKATIDCGSNGFHLSGLITSDGCCG